MIGDIDKEYISQGKIIIGVDEVGKGCIAGSMFIGFVSLNILSDYKNINDSKKLSNKNRLELDLFIKNNGKHLIKEITANEINTGKNLNKLYLNKFIEGINELLNIINVNKNNVVIFMDGIDILKINDYNIIYKPKMDSLSINVAAASIIAKNIQVSEMIKFHEKYPNYYFDSHNGYATKKHREAIKNYGITEIHRKNWIKD